MSNKHHFLKLTPTADTALDIYADAMEYVFDNDDIRNIAISGTYGAGKSSMIETYEKEHSDKKFLHISLAHFGEKEETEKFMEKGVEGAKRVSAEAALEGKILNQLLHQIDPNDISQTDFRTKKDSSDSDKKEIIKLTWGTVLFVLCICFLHFNAAWCDMVSRFSIPFLRILFFGTVTREAELVVGIIAVFLTANAIKRLITMQKDRRILKKFSFKGNEIEIFSDSKDSYFDKYLNEVIYLFEHADVDGTVFEDIDRYDNKLIFEKLREINFLLNRRKEQTTGKEEKEDKPKPIRFFYLMRDEIFVSKDRVKFFDFIIPIVPTMNAANAYDILTKYFEDAGLLSLFDKFFLKNIALYIDDRRLLMNVFNEFLIYHGKMGKVSSGLKNEKLLAMILYKNLFPEDFGMIQSRQGYVYTLFDNADIIRQECLEKLQEKLKDCEAKNKKLQENICRDIDELNAVYFVAEGIISIDGQGEEKFSSRKEFVKAALKSSNLSIYNFTYRRWYDYDIKPAIEKMEQNPEYIERKKAIAENPGKKLRREMARINNEIDNVKRGHLKELINRDNSKRIFNWDFQNGLSDGGQNIDIRQDAYFPLVKYLIGEGYIDETYPDYMSYFYENNITRTDKEFLRSITDKEAKPYDFAIKNPKEVVESIRLEDFEEEEIFNVDILDYLLQNDIVYGEQLQQFIKGIWNYEPEGFVLQYLRTGKRKWNFIDEFNKYWAGACRWILKEEKLPEEIKRQYIVGTLCASSKEVIEKNNIDNVIIQYVESQSDFLPIEKEYEEALKAGLRKVNVKFQRLNYERLDKQFFDFIYQNKMFALTIETVDEILRHIYGIKNPENRREKHISLILSRPQEVLCEYVKDNIADYLNILLEKIERSNDNDETILFLLNNENISDKVKEQFIKIQERQISSLLIVEKRELWPVILEYKKVTLDTANILDYFFLSGNGLDEKLISYINEFEDRISFKPELLAEEYGETATQDLFDAVLPCSGIRIDIYESVLNALDITCKYFDNEELGADRVKTLIKCRIILMEAKQLQFIRNIYADLCPYYIRCNIDTYTSIITNGLAAFSSEELNMVFEYPEVSDEIKLALLQLERKPISIQNKDYSEELQQYILRNNYEPDDLSYLVEGYPTMSAVIKAEIYRIAVEGIETITNAQIKVPAALFNKLMKESSISVIRRQLLLAVQCNLSMWQERAKTALKDLGLLSYLELFDGGEVLVENTSQNRQLLQAFESRNWITNFGIDGANFNYIKACGIKKERKSKGKDLVKTV